MKYTKSIIFFLFFIFLIVMVNSFFVIYLIQNNEIKNAYIINELGQIRGGTQRYAKLKINKSEKEKILSVENYIDEKYNDIQNIYKDIIPNEAIDFFENNFLELKKTWKILKKTKTPQKIYNLSEKSWEIADSLVIYTAKSMESKTQKILFLIILISVITIMTTLIIIFLIYNVISKSLNLKTLKDPISKLYNIYHLNETLSVLQNRYQRYSKTFAVLKITIFEPNEKKFKDIGKILKNKIRRSDKIFNSKDSIIIIFLEPDKITLEKVASRIEKLISNISKIKESKYAIYNGEKIEEFI